VVPAPFGDWHRRHTMLNAESAELGERSDGGYRLNSIRYTKNSDNITTSMLQILYGSVVRQTIYETEIEIFIVDRVWSEKKRIAVIARRQTACRLSDMLHISIRCG
jgi:hypothetical protein